jgi:alpha-glucosidase
LTAGWVRENQKERLAGLPNGAWPCNTLNNHDSGRVWSNFGDGVNDEALAKLSLAVVLLLKGTPCLYNGEEIGMRNFLGFRLDEFRDPISRRVYDLEQRLLGINEAEALEFAARNGRDKGRTPYQWDGTDNGGFCPAGVRSWLPVSADYLNGVNLAEQTARKNSVWNFYRNLLHLRRTTPALIEGDYQAIEMSENVLGFLRQSMTQSILVWLNFEGRARMGRVEAGLPSARRIFSSQEDGAEEQHRERVSLQPFEIWVGLAA